MFGFRFGSKKFLGVDIGTSSIRIVEISKKGKSFGLENYGEARNFAFNGNKNFNNPKNNKFFSGKNVAEIIRAISKEAGIKIKDANFAIPDFRSFFTSFKVPKMNKKELDEAIRYEVRPYIPLPLSEITLDWTITEGEPSKTPLKILVVAVPNEVISQYQKIADLSGFKLKALESEVFALARASNYSSGIESGAKKPDKKKKKNIANTKEKADSGNVIGLIDIGALTSTCSIAENRVLKTSHSFRVGTNQLIDRLAKSLNIDYNKAKDKIIKNGLVEEDIKIVLIPLINVLISDIKKSFWNFYQTEGKEVEKIILAGGISLMPGLREYMFSELKKEIIISNPFSNISYPPVLEKTLAKIGPNYAISVGLALRGLEK